MEGNSSLLLMQLLLPLLLIHGISVEGTYSRQTQNTQRVYGHSESSLTYPIRSDYKIRPRTLSPHNQEYSRHHWLVSKYSKPVRYEDPWPAVSKPSIPLLSDNIWSFVSKPSSPVSSGYQLPAKPESSNSDISDDPWPAISKPPLPVFFSPSDPLLLDPQSQLNVWQKLIHLHPSDINNYVSTNPVITTASTTPYITSFKQTQAPTFLPKEYVGFPTTKPSDFRQTKFGTESVHIYPGNLPVFRPKQPVDSGIFQSEKTFPFYSIYPAIYQPNHPTFEQTLPLYFSPPNPLQPIEQVNINLQPNGYNQRIESTTQLTTFTTNSSIRGEYQTPEFITSRPPLRLTSYSSDLGKYQTKEQSTPETTINPYLSILGDYQTQDPSIPSPVSPVSTFSSVLGDYQEQKHSTPPSAAPVNTYSPINRKFPKQKPTTPSATSANTYSSVLGEYQTQKSSIPPTVAPVSTYSPIHRTYPTQAPTTPTIAPVSTYSSVLGEYQTHKPTRPSITPVGTYSPVQNKYQTQEPSTTSAKPTSTFTSVLGERDTPKHSTPTSATPIIYSTTRRRYQTQEPTTSVASVNSYPSLPGIYLTTGSTTRRSVISVSNRTPVSGKVPVNEPTTPRSITPTNTNFNVPENHQKPELTTHVSPTEISVKQAVLGSISQPEQTTPSATLSNSSSIVLGTFSTSEATSTKATEDLICDYSKFHLEHSMTLEVDTECNIIRSGVPEDEVEEILRVHNTLRSKVARGAELRGKPGPQLPAANMRVLYWNDELASVAQAWANQCQSSSEEYAQRRICSRGYDVGQNVYYEWSHSDTQNWDTAINKWYAEVSSLPYSYVFGSQRGQPIKDIDHYTQLVWAETQEVGCGAVYYSPFMGGVSRVYVCNYGPTSHPQGSPMYQVGLPATACDALRPSDKYPELCP
ncbi:uncharacterized protein [Procambarus clarkii]|uniref:uncharacterized protein n=1 Tax=Procambarus clarkii TaxID=6728 RepID=UPI0037437B2D